MALDWVGEFLVLLTIEGNMYGSIVKFICLLIGLTKPRIEVELPCYSAMRMVGWCEVRLVRVCLYGSNPNQSGSLDKLEMLVLITLLILSYFLR